MKVYKYVEENKKKIQAYTEKIQKLQSQLDAYYKKLELPKYDYRKHVKENYNLHEYYKAYKRLQNFVYKNKISLEEKKKLFVELRKLYDTNSIEEMQSKYTYNYLKHHYKEMI